MGFAAGDTNTNRYVGNSVPNKRDASGMETTFDPTMSGGISPIGQSSGGGLMPNYKPLAPDFTLEELDWWTPPTVLPAVGQPKPLPPIDVDYWDDLPFLEDGLDPYDWPIPAPDDWLNPYQNPFYLPPKPWWWSPPTPFETQNPNYLPPQPWGWPTPFQKPPFKLSPPKPDSQEGIDWYKNLPVKPTYKPGKPWWEFWKPREIGIDGTIVF